MAYKRLQTFLIIAAIFYSSFAGAAPDQTEGWVVAEAKRSTGYDLADYEPSTETAFLFKEETFRLKAPSLVKADEIWVPVQDLIQNMGMVFLRIDDNTFGIIRDDGIPLELKVGSPSVTLNKQPYTTIGKPAAIYDGAFMLSLDGFSKLIDKPCSFDAAVNSVRIGLEEHAEKVEEMETFTIPVTRPPPEELPEAPPLPVAKAPIDIVEEALPAKYRRDIDAHLDFNMSYLEDKFAHDRTRQAEWYLSGRAYDYTVDGHFRMKDFRTTGKQSFKEDGETLAISSKDVRFDLFDNYITIPTLRSQSMSFFGVKGAHFYKPFDTTVWYGRTDNTVSGPVTVGSVRYYGQILAARSVYTAPTDILKTGQTFIYWHNDAEVEGKVGTTTFPRRNIAFITENRITPYKGLDLNYSYGLSNFQPDNKVNATFLDNDWKTGMSFAQDRFAASAYYEHVGAQYASIGLPQNYQDYEGWDFSTSFRFTQNWNASIGAQLYKNNVEGNPRVATNFTKSMNASSGLNLPWEQLVTVAWTVSENYSRGGDQDQAGTRYQDYRVDYSKTWGTMSAQFSYDHYSLDAFTTGTSNQVTEALSFSLFNVYPEINNSYLRYFQNYRKVKNFANNTYTTETIDTILSGRLNVTNYLSASADWRVTFTKAEALTDTALMTLTIGSEFKSSPVTVWNFDFTLSSFDLYDQKTWLPKHYTVLFRGKHIFDYFTSDKWGGVEALVYKDVNGNSAYDADEPGLKDVRVYVSNGRAAFTNNKGKVVINKVVAGERQVKLDLSTLPLSFVARGESVKDVTIEPLKVVKLEFPVVQAGSITGRVYIDNNDNGMHDKGIDEAVPNARIFLAPGELDTLTLSDGSYYFDYVYPGDYDICLDTETIPAGATAKISDKIAITLKEEEALEKMDFVLLPRKVEIQYLEE